MGEIHGDEADIASEYAERDNQRALAKHHSRPKPSPEYDDEGNKVCIDCTDAIPIQRAEIIGTVRCIECQELYEREDKR
jgi:RNA polymerase-binding transcription factor DksA